MKFDETQQKDVEFQVAPLADIVFLLLIFFMLVTTVKQSAECVKNLPRATEGKEILGKAGEVTINITQDGEIIIGRTIHQISTLKGYLESLVEPSLLNVYLRGDKEVVWGEINDVIKACAEIGIANISFGVYQKQEEVASK
ncbi:MAG: biopolymer transporter ExbD [bacterium]|nr:biopolymer transporter ExbD [bacterium]